MIDSSASVQLHPELSFWLDVFTKIAVVVGGLWTAWNYAKSRPYSQKLDLQLSGDLFTKNDLYIDVAIVLKNLGASKHFLQSAGTSCDILAVFADLSEQNIRLFPIFSLHNQIEPGESINDHVLWRIQDPPENMIWIKVNLRVVSSKVEWNTTSMVRVDPATPVQLA